MSVNKAGATPQR